MKQYNYKVVGVTFPARDGSSRQKSLRDLWNEDVELDNSFHEVKLEGYEFEGADALAVLLDGKEVGNIPADKVQDVAEIGQKADACEVTLTLNGRDFEDAKTIIEFYKERHQLVKDGVIHELDLDRVEEEYHELMSGEKVYGAVLHFRIMTQEEKDREAKAFEEWKKAKQERQTSEIKKPKYPRWVWILLLIIGVLMILMGALLLLASPGTGIVAIIIGVAEIVLARRKIKGTTGQKNK